MKVAKTESLFDITPRKGHSSVIYCKLICLNLLSIENSMIVYGGELNTGKVTDEILTLNLTNLEWIRVEVLKPCKKGIYHGACAAVFRDKNLIQTFTETTQPSYVSDDTFQSIILEILSIRRSLLFRWFQCQRRTPK
jgi:hypothetical protein